MVLFKRILFVEDDPRDIELTFIAFGKSNLANDIEVAHDGVEALDYLYRRNAYASRPIGNPVVIFLDIKMPRLDGIQVLEMLKKDDLLNAIPVVMLTSSQETKDVDECYRLGANSYVVKPVRFSEFVETVKQVGIYWTTINEPPHHSAGKDENTPAL